MNYHIGIFCYNRPSHLKRVLIALESCNVRDLTIFLDGPRNTHDKKIQKTILFMLKYQKKIKIKIIRRKKNFGLSKSLISGIDYLANRYKNFIILEDDVVPYKKFFQYIDINLKKFKNNENVECLCSYQFPETNNIIKKKNYSMFSDFYLPWGWATWSHKWKKFRNFKLKKKLIDNYKKNIFYKKFYLKKFNSKTIWSSRYALYMLLNNKKSVYPSSSLVKNIGFDGSGINSKISNDLNITENNFSARFDKMVYNKKLDKIFNKTLKKRIKIFY